MCGRYRLSRHKEILAERFGVDPAELDPEDNWQPRYNIAPTQNVPVIRQDAEEPKRFGSRMRWGLIPFWAKNKDKEAGIGHNLINARAETAAVQPAFRDALRYRRCLIPADGFYEWCKSGRTKIPFCFALTGEEIFAFAGLWETWRNPAGRSIETCCILTTPANALVQDIHDRMPVILPDDAYDVWLDPGLRNVHDLRDLLMPFDANLMRRYQVSNRINLVTNDDPACALPAGLSP